MATQEAVMGRIIAEVRSGAAGKPLGDAAVAKLRELYWSWIEQMDITEHWDKDARLRGRFQEIGKRSAQQAGGDEIDSGTLETVSLTVESESECPLCPPRP